eukprot:10193266-Alexandrium_andersonii.AAC.1
MISTLRGVAAGGVGTRHARRNRSWYGTRVAPVRWEALRTTTSQGFGVVRGKASACCFRHPD